MKSGEIIDIRKGSLKKYSHIRIWKLCGLTMNIRGPGVMIRKPGCEVINICDGLLNIFLHMHIPFIMTVLRIVTKSKVVIEHILVLTVTDLSSQMQRSSSH